MKVLLTGRGIPTKSYPTNGIFEFDQARALSKNGVDVLYLFVDLRSFRRKRKFGFVEGNLNGVEYKGFNIPIGAIPRFIKRPVKYFLFNYLFKTITRDGNNIDIIHSQFFEPSFAISKVATKNNITHIITEHSSKFNQETLDPTLKRLGQNLYPTAAAVIAVSPSFCLKLNKWFNIDTIYIPNIVDLDLFSKSISYLSNESTFIKSEKTIFASTGNLIESKKMDLTVRAFASKFKDEPETFLYIFGQGSKRDELQKLITDLKMEKHIFLKGIVDRKELAEFYKKVDFFVLASESETFGVAFIEALSMGIPVISAKSGGPESFINTSNGLLVEANNISSLGDAMVKIKDIKYNRQKIAKEIQSTYSYINVTKQIIDVYNIELLKKNKGREE